jgi:transposase-like protein
MPMAKARMDLTALIGKLLEEQEGDVLREGIRVLSQALMESEVAGLIGAERYERTDPRTALRNGTRTRT